MLWKLFVLYLLKRVLDLPRSSLQRALLHNRGSAGWQESLGFPGCAHFYPKYPVCFWGSLQPSILNFPLCNVEDICAFSNPPQSTQAHPWGREIPWKRKRRSIWLSPAGNLDPTAPSVLAGRDQPSRECRKESRELVFWAGNNHLLQPLGQWWANACP